MTTRRAFIASVLASAALPSLTWADAGGPSFLSAAREPDGTYALFGLTLAGQETFRIPLPARGHAGAAHPHQPEAVVFARRPGTYALVIDCLAGLVSRELTAPAGYHFSGHGVFSADGQTLFTGEVDNVTGQGMIGVWAQTDSYRRVRSFPSGGIGPHEILRLPGRDVLVVGNGGIIAALDDDRTKLNIDTMQSNLSYLSASGDLLDQVTLLPDFHKNSIRHLAVDNDDRVVFGMQWEGDMTETPALIGMHKFGQDLRVLDVPQDVARRMAGYIGSIAVASEGGTIAASCPKGNIMVLFDATGAYSRMFERPDVCGLAPDADSFVATDGFGGIVGITQTGMTPLQSADRAWDNHLVQI